MAANVSSVLPIEWTRLLKDNPELTMKDVDTFVKLNKAPQSGIVKGYKFFCKGFIKDYEGKSFMSAVFAFGQACKAGRAVSKQVLTYRYDCSLSW